MDIEGLLRELREAMRQDFRAEIAKLERREGLLVYTRQQAAQALGISPATLKRRIRAGLLLLTEDGRVARSEVERLAAPIGAPARKKGPSRKAPDYREESRSLREALKKR